MADQEHFAGSAHSTSEEGYRVRIRLGHHEVVADEPAAQGGKDEGPAPYPLLLAGLAACTSITLKMYAEKKGWELGELKVDLALFHDSEGDRIERTLLVSSSLSEEQRARLLEISEKTPVTKTLKRAATIVTKLG